MMSPAASLAQVQCLYQILDLVEGRWWNITGVRGREYDRECGGLNDKCPHDLSHLNAWFPVGDPI